LPWLKANVAIPERTASQYLLLWDHNEEIKAAFKSAGPADLVELPPIKDALALIANKRAEKHPHTVTGHQVVHRIPANTPTAARSPGPAGGQATNHREEEEPNEYCEVGWVLFTTERDMAPLALTPKNEEWKKSALGFFESLRNRKIVTVS
jgi:hypothetical protein